MKVAVVGAGLAGLMAARQLQAEGHRVTVFERDAVPGGRLSTRDIGAARVDSGAQFFTVRTDELASHVARWCDAGVVREWCRGFGSEPDGHPRYVARDGMSALAAHLADGLDVRTSSLVFTVDRVGATWRVRLDDASVTAHDAIVVTCPLPQAYSLLVTARVPVPDVLWRTDYDRTLALLAVLDRPSAMPEPGAVHAVAPFQFVADNAAKGVSRVPALTLHADAEWSLAHWDDDRSDVAQQLVALAGPFLGDAQIVECQLRRWRFATPMSVWPEPCWSPADGTPLVVAGDAFAGPRVEGAALSGLAAAARLLEM